MFTNDQRAAYDTLLSGRNVFLTGEGGTGKSYLIKTYIKQKREQEHKNVLICAPTGIAALNLGGVTIHKALRMPTRVIVPDDYESKKKLKKAYKLLRETDVFIMDEVSMCRLDQFNLIAASVERANKWRDKHNEAPIQFIVVGDFYQLPPVVTAQDREVFYQAYGYDIGDGYAFSSPYWNEMDFTTINLIENVRQQGSGMMQVMLNAVRDGRQELNPIAYFNDNANENVISDGIYLTGLRRKADAINDEHLNALSSPLKTFQARVTDVFSDNQFPAETYLKLKVGAKVMTTVNDTENDEYKNGSIGTVTAIRTVQNKPVVTVRFEDGHTVDIKQHKWDVKDITLDEDGQLKEKTTGSFTQLPLRLAYAITIHKSQGCTFDKVNLDPYCFANGQLYVALSRCTSMDGLHLMKPIKARDWQVADDVVAFYDNNYEISEEQEQNNPYALDDIELD